PRLNRSIVHLAMGMAEATRDAALPQFQYALTDALEAVALCEANMPAQTDRQRREIALTRTAAGEALLRMGDDAKFEEAIGHFNRPVAAAPRHARAYFLQAQISRQRKQPAEAVLLLSRAVDVDPNDPDIYDTYTTWGEVLKDMGKPRDAQ